jgi:acid phosphatase
MVPALGIFPSPHDNPLPADTYDSDRVFWTTAIVPMGGHIVIERLDCGSSGPQVRVLVNERIQSVPGCESAKTLGVGLCDLNQFETIVKGRWDTTFCEACAPDEPDCVDSISFFEP